jgi:phospholipid N-methyltransferase
MATQTQHSDIPLPAPATGPDRHTGRAAASLQFLLESLRSPFAVGAVCPTSQRLAEALVRAAPVSDARCIVELGAGTGAVTERIVQRQHANSTVVAIERNAAFASTLRQRFPSVHVRQECVTRLECTAAAQGFDNADIVVSALPWTLFSNRMCIDILDSISNILAPGGCFVTIACLGLHTTARGRAMRTALENMFSHFNPLSPIWMNLPPALIYRCIR